MVNDVGDDLLRHAVLRLNGTVIGLVFGIMLGLLVFIATNWLVIKGGPQVGPHLSLLGQFFVGYSVTFLGSLIGMGYGFVAGFLTGAFVGWLYNRIVAFRSK